MRSYKELFGKPAEDVSYAELMMGLGKFEAEMPKDPQQRPFAHLKRGPDGKFDDGDLAKIMTDGIEQVSGAFGARNIPKCLRAITILGMEQARAW
jgi:linoleate 10R-lipoxygenase